MAPLSSVILLANMEIFPKMAELHGAFSVFNLYGFEQRKFWLYWTPEKEMAGFGYYIDTDYSDPYLFEYAMHQFVPNNRWSRASV